MVQKLKDLVLQESKELVDNNSDDEDENHLSLPCGIIPGKYFSKYLGLFAYFAKKPEKVYNIFKIVYKFHFSKLFYISPKSTENLIGKF